MELNLKGGGLLDIVQVSLRVHVPTESIPKPRCHDKRPSWHLPHLGGLAAL